MHETSAMKRARKQAKERWSRHGTGSIGKHEARRGRGNPDRTQRIPTGAATCVGATGPHVRSGKQADAAGEKDTVTDAADARRIRHAAAAFTAAGRSATPSAGRHPAAGHVSAARAVPSAEDARCGTASSSVPAGHGRRPNGQRPPKRDAGEGQPDPASGTLGRQAPDGRYDAFPAPAEPTSGWGRRSASRDAAAKPARTP